MLNDNIAKVQEQKQQQYVQHCAAIFLEISLILNFSYPTNSAENSPKERGKHLRMRLSRCFY
jgi:hypothetical protein